MNFVARRIPDADAAPTVFEVHPGEIPFDILEEKDVAFECNCSMKRAISLISSLGQAEVSDMLEKDKGAVMDCGFCNEKYELGELELKKILTDL